MKRIGLILVVFLVIGGAASAVELPALQASNARIMAMGGAFTAVADNADALFYNPAGLVYLRNLEINVGLSLLADTNSNLVGFDMFNFREGFGYDVWDLRYDDAVGVYKDNNGNGMYDPLEGEVPFNTFTSVFGFEESWDGLDAFDAWYDKFIPMMDVVHTGFDKLAILPNLSFTNRNFGIGFLGGVTISPANVELPSTKSTIPVLDYGFEISKKSGIIAGMGFGFGSLSIGANLKYYKEVKTLFGLPTNSFIDFEDYVTSLVPDTPLQQALVEIFLDDAIAIYADTENHIEMGLGAMYTMGSLTVGAYVDSILGLILDENGELKDIDFEALVDKAAKTANIGVSFDPSMRKIYWREPLFNLLVSADLKNIGDDAKRFLNIGAEVGVHIGELAQVDFRGGYKQYLIGPLEDVFSSDIISLEQGEVSLGVGVKALFVNVNVAAALPAELVQEIVGFAAFNNFPDDAETYFLKYGPNFPRVMVSFGFNL